MTTTLAISHAQSTLPTLRCALCVFCVNTRKKNKPQTRHSICFAFSFRFAFDWSFGVPASSSTVSESGTSVPHCDDTRRFPVSSPIQPIGAHPCQRRWARSLRSSSAQIIHVYKALRFNLKLLARRLRLAGMRAQRMSNRDGVWDVSRMCSARAAPLAFASSPAPHVPTLAPTVWRNLN